MSGPNTDYDPVEVTPLKADEVEAMRDAALEAIAGAGDLDELKQVRLEHTGDRSPLALANREIGALPPQARKEAGQRVGQARGAVNKALGERTAVLESEHEERMLVEETVDVTLPTGWHGAFRYASCFRSSPGTGMGDPGAKCPKLKLTF